jgi:hypothetical protein
MMYNVFEIMNTKYFILDTKNKIGGGKKREKYIP